MEDRVKDFFDKVKAAAVVVGEKAEKGAAAAGKKAEEIFESAKINVHIADLNGDISTASKEIGRMVYDAHTGKAVDDARVEEILKGIDDKNAEIKRLKDQLNTLKSNKTCPVCGQVCGRDDSFCKRCGHTFEK